MKNHLICLTVVVLLSTTTVFAQQSAVFAPDGKALRGYDVVAYFNQNQPTKGDSTISYAYEGANWYFANVANRELFRANPQKYVPQYGGYCAYGTSEGHKAPTQPDAWAVVDDKLYLNYSTKVKTLWDKQRDERIQKANGQWLLIKDKP